MTAEKKDITPEEVKDVEYNKMKKIINQNTSKIKDLEDDMNEIDEEKDLKEAAELKKKNPDKRSRLGMIIGIIVFVLILSALIAAIIVMQKKLY